MAKALQLMRNALGQREFEGVTSSGGTLEGEGALSFFDYVYFSGVTYSSLGMSNVDATRGLQLLAVVESVLGLVFIGWTVTFTYAVTEKYLYHRRNPKA